MVTAATNGSTRAATAATAEKGAPPAQAAAKTASRLAKVQKGRLGAPRRILVYGTHGIGKSTLAADAPDPLWFDIEDGSGELEVARYSFRDDPAGHVPHTYAEVLSALDDLATADHQFRTLVIDTVDKLEALMWRHMLARDSKPGKELRSIEDYGYGKGYQAALDEWRGFCSRLDRLRLARSMTIVLLGHSQIRKFANPAGDDYDRYQLAINDKAAGLLSGWVDATAFAAFDEGGAKLAGEQRSKGFSTGRRLLHLDRSAAWDAKTRLALPAEIEMDVEHPWAPFAAALEAARAASADDLCLAISAELARVGDDALTTKVTAAVAAALKQQPEAAVPVLSRYLNELRRRAPREENTNAA